MDFTAARARLIDSFGNDIYDTRVLEAMKRVPRELFVPLSSRSLAYHDMPLPIGYNQTISQPYIIALMTQSLKLTGNEKVLELGTGSGYQAAILAELARQVVSTERYPVLAENAAALLKQLGYNNVSVHIAEDTLGWQREAPYDAIIVTAGAPQIPEELVTQLTIGGRMVIPVGTRELQQLCKITRTADKYEITDLGGCYFVPLIGRGAWENKE
ncbi:MAG: protein-L-isoaspartate(D-aspartate) O-methyltransferase [Dehalococcoidales bacterium]|nr:protein-L-isoaspartate(D-aspartate) O-methyltransferase [Dehalococcoidales bacterium]